MNNKQKLAALCQWLEGQGVTDYITHLVTDRNVVIDLYIPKYEIAVHLTDGRNKDFYDAVCKEYKPFIIRTADTVDFLIYKMQNCMAGHTCRTAPKYRKPVYTAFSEKHEKQDPRPLIKRRQRVRVNVQRVTPKRK